MKASEIKAGMQIALSGYQWIVRKVTFDPHGNTGNQPRMLFTCDAIGDHKLPDGYAKNCTLGSCVDIDVEVTA